MNEQSRALINAIRGPIILITVGVLFLVDHFTGYGFHLTWPVLLIVLGVLRLLGGGRRRYRDYQTPPQNPADTNTTGGR